MVTKPSKPFRKGGFLISERFKSLGRFAQMKFGRRLILEVKIDIDRPFRETEAFLTLRNQVEEFHQKGWQPKARVGKKKHAVIEQRELFFLGDVEDPKPLNAIPELEDLF